MTFKRAISHIHTHHSFDCTVPPYKIVEKAVRMKIDTLIITDHDTLAGSVEAAAYAAKKGYSLYIPIAAEFTTDIGDVIVSGVSPDFSFEKDRRSLCRKAKDQGGFTLLPHPYKGHKLQLIDYDLIDCIEIYNARCTVEENLLALQLARELKKAKIYGSDAHTLADLGNAVFSYEGDHPFDGRTEGIRLLPTSWMHNEYSRFIRGVKLGKTKECLRAIKRSLRMAAYSVLGIHEEY